MNSVCILLMCDVCGMCWVVCSVWYMRLVVCVRCKEACGVCCAFGTVSVVMSVVCIVCCVVWVTLDLFQECLLENECYLIPEMRAAQFKQN